MILNQTNTHNDYPTLVFDAIDMERLKDDKLTLLKSCIRQGFTLALDCRNCAHLSPQLLLRLPFKHLILPEEYFAEGSNPDQNDDNSNHHHWARCLMLCRYLNITCILPNSAQKEINMLSKEEQPPMEIYWLDHPTLSLTPFLKSNKEKGLTSNTRHAEVENVI